MKKNNSRDLEPQWVKDAAKSMLSFSKESYGDEDQNDLMAEIDNKDHESSIDYEPEWLTRMAKRTLQNPKEPYGDEDQNELMEIIDEIRTE